MAVPGGRKCAKYPPPWSSQTDCRGSTYPYWDVRFFAQSLVCRQSANLLRSGAYCPQILVMLALPACVGVYWVIALAEEEFLRGHFDQEYVNYCRTVNRFIPNFTKLCQSLVCEVFNWKRAVRKEARILCSWRSLAVGLLIWAQWKQFGFNIRRTEIVLLTCLWLLTVSLAYGVLWWWKRK